MSATLLNEYGMVWYIYTTLDSENFMQLGISQFATFFGKSFTWKRYVNAVYAVVAVVVTSRVRP